jgi:hypothetical protein
VSLQSATPSEEIVVLAVGLVDAMAQIFDDPHERSQLLTLVASMICDRAGGTLDEVLDAVRLNVMTARVKRSGQPLAEA